MTVQIAKDLILHLRANLKAGKQIIGGGVVIDGRQVRGATGYAGELGHVRISDSAQEDYSGISGTLESIVRRDSLLETLKIKSVTEEELDEAILAATSEETVREIHLQIDALAIGVVNFVNVFNPQTVILSGFLSSLFRYDVERLLHQFRKNTLIASQEDVVVIPGKLGSNLLMIGAAELPIDQHGQNPSGISLIPANRKLRKT